MLFPFNVYAAAVIGAFAAALATAPLWRRWCLRIGLVDDPGHRKIHDQPVALAGGLAVFTGLVAPLVCGLATWWTQSPTLHMNPSQNGPTFLDPNTLYFVGHGFSRRALKLGAIFAGALGMLLIGWLDDKHELKPAAKFSGQFAVALLVAASGIRITLFVDNLLFSYAVTILWILTVINAFNFMDNMNGLCSGLAAIAAWQFAWVAASDGQYLVAGVAFLTFGSMLGFLPHNFPAARAFLGDSGSHLAGYLMAVLAILPHFYSATRPRPLAVLLPLLFLAVPLVDMAWVVVLRLRAGKPFYIGDTNHLSHRLARLGCSRTRAVLLIWLLAAAAGALSLLVPY